MREKKLRKTSRKQFCFCPSQTPKQSYRAQRSPAQNPSIRKLTFRSLQERLSLAALTQPSPPFMQHSSISCAAGDARCQQEPRPHGCQATASLPGRHPSRSGFCAAIFFISILLSPKHHPYTPLLVINIELSTIRI